VCTCTKPPRTDLDDRGDAPELPALRLEHCVEVPLARDQASYAVCRAERQHRRSRLVSAPSDGLDARDPLPEDSAERRTQ